jgi:hypothetical protein
MNAGVLCFSFLGRKARFVIVHATVYWVLCKKESLSALICVHLPARLRAASSAFLQHREVYS